MHTTSFARFTTTLAAVLVLGLTAGCADDSVPTSPAAGSTGSLGLAVAAANIAGTTGATVDPDAGFPQYYLRYVGDPAPAGYVHYYQWGTPRIVTLSPEDGPVTISGTLDVDDQNVGQTTMIGLIDLALLEAGISSGHQSGAYIYVSRSSATQWRIGVSDGNDGGEIVQTFIVVSDTDLPADGILDVVFTVDGTADGTTCASGPVTSPAGCMTLNVDGGSVDATLQDSYGDVIGTASASTEFANGAIPGWDDYLAANVIYDLTITPVVVNDPQTKDDCKDGGWEAYGFANQGRCIQFVNTGKDSR